jgi:hypothetical protein
MASALSAAGDAICVLGGDAIVHVTVLERSSAVAYERHTGSRQPVRHEPLIVSLEALQPYPFSSRPPIAPADSAPRCT